jgi:hypothetical protein
MGGNTFTNRDRTMGRPIRHGWKRNGRPLQGGSDNGVPASTNGGSRDDGEAHGRTATRGSTARARVVEIVNPSGVVSYRRPEGHPDIEEAKRAPGYTLRFANGDDASGL